MYMISFLWNTILSIEEVMMSLLPFVVLLGILVFIHELGHFLVARFYGVRVEVFSLGFGKKILQWKKKDTVYCISLIPLGGYVKMFGHLDHTEVAKKDRSVSFSHKPVQARMAIVLAGPLMNLFLAIGILTISFMIGEKKISPVVGEVKQMSSAQLAGFKWGDTLLSVQAVKKNTPTLNIHNWTEFHDIVFNNPNQVLKIKVKKPSGEIKTLSILTEKKTILSDFGFEKQGGVIDGLSPFTTPLVVGVSDPQSPAGRAGIKTFDTLLSVNGKAIRHWEELKHIFEKQLSLAPIASTTQKAWQIQFQREHKTLTTTLTLHGQKDIYTHFNILQSLGLEHPDLFIAHLKKDSVALQAGLKKGDLIVKINDQKMNTWVDLTQKVGNFKPQDEALRVEINRQGQKKVFFITPFAQRVMKGLKEESRYMLGVVSGASYYQLKPAGKHYRQSTWNPFKALILAIKKTGYWCAMTGIYIKNLVSGAISKKTLGGVIAIGQAAYKSYRLGLEYFFEIMALLSVQLFLLNILPLPVLDGGHLLFYIIELIKGSPVSMQKMLIAHYIGLTLLLSLLIFVTFNDIDRWMNIW